MNHTRKNWLNIISLLIGIAGFSLSLHSYLQSKVDREPKFLVDPNRVQIISSSTISEFPIKIIKSNGRELASDLNVIKFYLWNDGKKAIKKMDILKQLVIKSADTDVNILDLKLLKKSRDVTDLSFDMNTDSKSHFIDVNLKILEYNDGAVGQILYEGSPDADFQLSGVIEGAEIINSPQALGIIEKVVKFFINDPFKVLIMGITLWIIILSLSRFERTKESFNYFHELITKKKYFTYLIFIFMVIGFITSGARVWQDISDSSSNRVYQHVPLILLDENKLK